MAAKHQQLLIGLGTAPDAAPILRWTRQISSASRIPWLAVYVVVQYGIALGVFILVTILGFVLHPWIGYQAVALVYLLAVVLLALVVDRGAIFFGALLSAFGWNYCFVPPLYSFRISSPYDKMMFVTYFAVSLTVGQLMTRLRTQRAADHERERQLRDAEIQSRLVGESERLGRALLNSVSHELRTPIAAITGAASGLRASGELTNDQSRLTGEIESASNRLNRVVQSLLSAARLRSGQLRAELDWCEIGELIQVVQRSVSTLAAGHPLQVRIASDLPLVKMDFVLMDQVLSNLLVNAVTHTPEGTPIEISARLEGKEAVIEVADRGPGIPAEQLDRIFDLFHRLPGAKPGGTGLGLAIAKGFVEAQGGRIWANNRAGGGAAFAIAIPAEARPELPQELM